MKKYRYFKSKHHSLRLANVVCIGCISNSLMGFCRCGTQVRATQGVTLVFSQKGKQTHGVTRPQNQINCSEFCWNFMQSPVSPDKILWSLLPDFPFSSCCSLHPLTSAVNEVKIQDPTDNHFLPETALIQPRAGLSSAGKMGKGEREHKM